MTTLNQEPLSDQLKRGVEELQGVREEMMSLFEDVRVLASKEAELARVEMQEQISYVKMAAIYGGIAAIVGLLMLAFAATTVMFALDEAMPLWLAALITTAGLLVIAAIVGLLARAQLKQLTVTPKKTMESVSEDVKWARNRMSFSAR